MPEGSQTEAHPSSRDCIEALHAKLRESFEANIALRENLDRQRRSAENLGYEISHRFLAILEGLAQHPDVQVPFVTMIDGTPHNLHASQVAGIYAAILLKYREVCNWTPLADEREKVRDLIGLLGKAMWYLDPMNPVSLEISQKLVGIVVTPPEARPPDPSSS